jgi:hypothetical protein
MERWNNVQRLYGRSDASMRTNHRWMRYNRSGQETEKLSCFVVKVTKVIKEYVKTVSTTQIAEQRKKFTLNLM